MRRRWRALEHVGGAPVDAKTTANAEVMVPSYEYAAVQAAVWCGVSGVLGSLLMLWGDVLMYGPSAWGQPASVYFEQVDPVGSVPAQLAGSLMGAASRQRTFIGGLLGPVAGCFYVFGCAQLFLAALPMVKVSGEWRFSQAAWSSHVLRGALAGGGHLVLMVVVACYHSAFAYTAFIANAQLSTLTGADGCRGLACAGSSQLVDAHMAYMGSMKVLIKIFGMIGAVGLLSMAASNETPLFPRWLLLFVPTFWLLILRETGALGRLPGPLGLVLAGGSFNLAFLAFFCALTANAVFFRKQLAG